MSFCRKYLDIPDSADDTEFAETFIKRAFACSGDTLIIQMQDYLGLGS
mgnify:CR=1 FL=1